MQAEDMLCRLLPCMPSYNGSWLAARYAVDRLSAPALFASTALSTSHCRVSSQAGRRCKPEMGLRLCCGIAGEPWRWRRRCNGRGHEWRRCSRFIQERHLVQPAMQLTFHDACSLGQKPCGCCLAECAFVEACVGTPCTDEGAWLRGRALSRDLTCCRYEWGGWVMLGAILYGVFALARPPPGQLPAAK